jgi:hypothetical protein
MANVQSQIKWWPDDYTVDDKPYKLVLHGEVIPEGSKYRCKGTEWCNMPEELIGITLDQKRNPEWQIIRPA